jgi:hypothetical protein
MEGEKIVSIDQAKKPETAKAGGIGIQPLYMHPIEATFLAVCNAAGQQVKEMVYPVPPGCLVVIITAESTPAVLSAMGIKTVPIIGQSLTEN